MSLRGFVSQGTESIKSKHDDFEVAVCAFLYVKSHKMPSKIFLKNLLLNLLLASLRVFTIGRDGWTRTIGGGSYTFCKIAVAVFARLAKNTAAFTTWLHPDEAAGRTRTCNT